VLTSGALPERTPDHVTTAPTAGELIERMEAAGISGDVHLVGGPSTMQAFREIGALAEVRLAVIPLIQGGGLPLAPTGIEPLSLTLQSTRTFPDGVIEARYLPWANRWTSGSDEERERRRALRRRLLSRARGIARALKLARARSSSRRNAGARAGGIPRPLSPVMT
jgi:hypothetical protein